MPEIVTAIVCTRNRPDLVARTVGSLLQPDPEALELIVMDQSDGAETEQVLDRFAADPRLRYIRSRTRGKGAAMNEAIRLARGPIIVCTDDDCEAPSGWITSMARTLASQPTAAVVFCNVVPVPYDRKLGYVPAYELNESRLLRSVSAASKGIGLGAGMAIRRDFLSGIGGFDDAFGPGARFPSADDWDIALRALAHGRHVYETSELSIVHDGFRTFEEGKKHARRDWCAIGALCAKCLRSRHPHAAFVLIQLLLFKAIGPALSEALHLRKPPVGRITSFIRGFCTAIMKPVDRATLRFRSSGGAPNYSQGVSGGRRS